mmetsp:Transcript_74839/g.243041  ORF Transcript_74839/g.243041 Transcript_74839/m.243041 type:complete len:380 (-) Transcript_74839:1686-2825(-)
MRAVLTDFKSEADFLRAPRAGERVATARGLPQCPTSLSPGTLVGALGSPLGAQDVDVRAGDADAVVATGKARDVAPTDIAQQTAQVRQARVGRSQISVLHQAPMLAAQEMRVRRAAVVLALGLHHFDAVALRAELEAIALGLASPAEPEVLVADVLAAGVAPGVGELPHLVRRGLVGRRCFYGLHPGVEDAVGQLLLCRRLTLSPSEANLVAIPQLSDHPHVVQLAPISRIVAQGPLCGWPRAAIPIDKLLVASVHRVFRQRDGQQGQTRALGELRPLSRAGRRGPGAGGGAPGHGEHGVGGRHQEAAAAAAPRPGQLCLGRTAGHAWQPRQRQRSLQVLQIHGQRRRRGRADRGEGGGEGGGREGSCSWRGDEGSLPR